MSNIAIKVENLSKRYRIGLKEEMHDTFTGAVTSWIKSPFANYRRLRKLSHFDEPALKQPITDNSSPQSVACRPSSVVPSDEPSDVIWALRDVSFEVKQGEVVGIIGRNGAGKSTLLKILSRITEPTSGRAGINGRVSSLLEVGTGFHPELTGRENIYLNGTILGMTKPEIDRKFDEIVDFADVEKFIDTPVKRYSSGMQVRLAFAVAAHLEPEILLVDEVLAVGDAAFQKKCLGKMGDVAKEGRTVLFVSHNMTAIEALCPRAVLLEGGCLVDDDHSSQTIGRYLTSIVDRTPSDLRRRTDRQGTGVIRIVSFEILDSESKPVDSLITGKEYVFRFGYESRATKVYDIDFGFTVRDLRNQIFFRNRTSESGLTLPERISPCGYLDCKMRRLPLTAGRYAFGFRLLVNGIEADYITGGYAAYFDVVNGDYFGTGKITDFAPLVVEHTWQIVTGNTG